MNFTPKLQKIWGAGALLLSAGMLSAGPSPALARELVTVRLAQNLAPISGLAIIAEQQGLFRQEGLDVQVSNFTSGKQCLNTVIGGGAEIATTAEAPTTAAAMSGIPIALVARMEYSDLKTLTAAKAGIDSIAALKGKRIAFTAGTGSEVYTAALLKRAKLTSGDVILVNLPPEAMLPALAAGSIDAYDTWEPYITKGQQTLGAEAKPLDTKGIYSETFSIVVLRDYLRDHQPAVEGFLKALIAAEAWVSAHPDEAIRVISSATGMKQDDLAAIWPDYVYHVILDQKQLEILETHARWRLETGNHPDGATMPDFRQILATGPLRDVAPDRVTVPGL